MSAFSHDEPAWQRGVLAIAFSADSAYLFTGGGDGKARVWDIQRGAQVAEFEAAKPATPIDLKLHPNGKLLVTQTSDGRIGFWEIASGRLVKQLKTRGIHGGTGLGLYADGRRLAAETSLAWGAGADSGTIEVWDIENSPRMVLSLNGPVLFDQPTFGPGPTGRRIMASSGDGAVHQWEAFPWETEEFWGKGEGRRENGEGVGIVGRGRLGVVSNQWSVVSDQSAGASGWRGGTGLGQRVREYADQYWRERFALEAEAEATNLPPRIIDLPVDRALFPKRDVKTTTNQIDLTDYYTGELGEQFFSTGPWYHADNDLSALTTGLQTLGGTQFDVRGVIQLRRGCAFPGPGEALSRNHPVRVEGIRVAQGSRRIHLLLGAVGAREASSGLLAFAEEEGTTIGAVILHYADGETHRLDLVFGQDTRTWWSDPAKPEPQVLGRGRVVWTGTNPVVQDLGLALRLYLTSRDNPRPDVKIATLDLVSALGRAAPFIVAITVE